MSIVSENARDNESWAKQVLDDLQTTSRLVGGLVSGGNLAHTGKINGLISSIWTRVYSRYVADVLDDQFQRLSKLTEDDRVKLLHLLRILDKDLVRNHQTKDQFDAAVEMYGILKGQRVTTDAVVADPTKSKPVDPINPTYYVGYACEGKPLSGYFAIRRLRGHRERRMELIDRIANTHGTSPICIKILSFVEVVD